MTDLHMALDAIEAQLHEMRSLKGWRLNLIRENLAKAKAAAPTHNAAGRDEIANIMQHWDKERGGIGFACFATEMQRQDAFTKADWTALTAIKAVLAKFCLIWPLSRAQNGYPTCGTNNAIRPHRIMCEYRNGPPPTPGHQAAHSCNNGHLGCVNPWHLSWKTPAENQLDRPDKHLRPQRKLRPDQVDEIRSMKGRERTVDTAARFQITEANVRQIQSGKIWRLDSKRRVFSDDEIRRVRAAPGGVGVAKGFAKEFGVSLSCIHNIRNGTFYKHVTSLDEAHHSAPQGE